MKSSYAVILAATLVLMNRSVDAQTHLDTTVIDQAVISKLSAQFGINSKVIVHLELTQTFQTKSRWSLVIAKQPDDESSVEDGGGNRIGAVSFCFVENDMPDCSEEMFLAKYREEKVSFVSGEPTFHELIASDIVYSGPGRTLSLLKIKSCMNRGANGIAEFRRSCSPTIDKRRGFVPNEAHDIKIALPVLTTLTNRTIQAPKDSIHLRRLTPGQEHGSLDEIACAIV